MTNFKFFKTTQEANAFIKDHGYGQLYKSPSKNYLKTVREITDYGYHIPPNTYKAVVLWNAGPRPVWA